MDKRCNNILCMGFLETINNFYVISDTNISPSTFVAVHLLHLYGNYTIVQSSSGYWLQLCIIQVKQRFSLK